MSKTEQLVIRLEPKVLKLADSVTALASKTAGIEMKRAAVCRTALQRGLELMLEELKPGRRRDATVRTEPNG